MIETTIDYDWPGWPLTNNPFGAEFDGEARKRMVIGSRKLIPYILSQKHKLSGSICEIGPFFNPLLIHDELKNQLTDKSEITFLENDLFAIEYLKSNISCNVVNINLNEIDSTNILEKCFLIGDTKMFDIIIISQVLNYVDYKKLLRALFLVLKKDGVLFINNSIDYGIPQLFSDSRPDTNNDLVSSAIFLGYHVLLKEHLPKMFATEITERLILALTKKR